MPHKVIYLLHSAEQKYDRLWPVLEAHFSLYSCHTVWSVNWPSRWGQVALFDYFGHTAWTSLKKRSWLSMLYYSHVHIYHAIGSGPLRQGADKIYSPRGRHFRHIPTTSRCGARQPGPHSHAVRPTRHLTRRGGARVRTSRPLWPGHHQVQRPGELLVYKLFYFNTFIIPIKLKLFILIHFLQWEYSIISTNNLHCLNISF